MPVLIKGGVVSGQFGLARIILYSPGCWWCSQPNGSLLSALCQSKSDTGAVDRGVEYTDPHGGYRPSRFGDSRYHPGSLQDGTRSPAKARGYRQRQCAGCHGPCHDCRRCIARQPVRARVRKDLDTQGTRSKATRVERHLAEGIWPVARDGAKRKADTGGSQHGHGDC